MVVEGDSIKDWVIEMGILIHFGHKKLNLKIIF